MRKPTPPAFFEPLPYYMTAMGMQGARFIEGNDGSGSGESGNNGDGEQGGDNQEGGEDGNDQGEQLKESGKKALEAERKRANELDKLLKAEQAKTKAFEDAKLTDAQRAEKNTKEQQEELQQLRRDNLRLTALAGHSIPEKYQALVKGETKEELDASAALIAELLAGAGGSGDGKPGQKQDKQEKRDPVPGSGSGGDGPSQKSFAAGAERYKQRNPKKD